MRSIVIFLILTSAAVAQPTWGAKPGTGTDSGKVFEYQNAMRPWAPHELDSLYKALRFKVKTVVPDTGGRYVPRDVITRIFDGSLATVRDSVVEYYDTLCIKWYIIPPATKGGWPRIFAKDTCAGAVCSPVVGDNDRIYNPWCDSLRLLTSGPQAKSTWITETLPTGGTKNAFVIKIDTIMVPIMFQIYASRGATTNMSDSTNKWMNVPVYNTTITGWPIGSGYSGKLKYVAWTQKYSSGTLSGGTWVASAGLVVATGKQVLARWVTNPSSRTGGNDKTKISLYTDDVTMGGDPANYGSPVNIASFEIDDNSYSSTLDTQTWHMTVVVWIAFVTPSF